MTEIRPVMPRQPVPDLAVPVLGNGEWRLSEQKPALFTMVVVYRGLHCPACKTYLSDLNAKAEEFEKRGVEVIAISCDDEERARQTKQDWGLDRLRIGYGLPFGTARDWGLYISSGRGKTSIGVEEPPLFAEPGLFLVRPDNTLYSATIQTMPFARPRFDDLLKAVDFIAGKDYPARGEVIDHPSIRAAQ